MAVSTRESATYRRHSDSRRIHVAPPRPKAASRLRSSRPLEERGHLVRGRGLTHLPRPDDDMDHPLRRAEGSNDLGDGVATEARAIYSTIEYFYSMTE